MKRVLNFDELHFAENLMQMDYFTLYGEINHQNITGKFEV